MFAPRVGHLNGWPMRFLTGTGSPLHVGETTVTAVTLQERGRP
jgi:hypothetical protein